MNSEKNGGNFEIDEDPAHERRQITAQRIGWGLMALIAMASCLGLIGPGPLSTARAGSLDSGLMVEYNRFDHYQAPSSLRIHLSASNPQISINRDYIDQMEVLRIEPEPAVIRAGPANILYEFRTDGEGPKVITMHFESRAIGTSAANLQLSAGPSVAFSQFFYP